MEQPFGFINGFHKEKVRVVKTTTNYVNFEEKETGLSQELSLPHDFALRLEKAENDAKVLVSHIDTLAEGLA